MTKRLEIDVKLNRPQHWIAKRLGRRRTLFTAWGRGVGKSFMHRLIWYLLVAQFDGKLREDALKPFRGIRIRALMPTLKQFKDVHQDGILAELIDPSGDWHWLGAHYNKSTGAVTFPGGSSIKPFPARAYSSQTARGLRADVLDCDEYDDIDSHVFDSVAIPWLSEPWSYGLQLLGGTPTRGRNGLFYRTLKRGKLGAQLRKGGVTAQQARQAPEFVDVLAKFDAFDQQFLIDLGDAILGEDHGIEEREELCSALAEHTLKTTYASHATYKDAPETVSPLAVAHARTEMSPAAFEREWEANADAGEGLVYVFDEDFHVKEVPPHFSFQEYFVGVDHGHTDPGVFLLFGVAGSGEQAMAWLLNEIYKTGEVEDFWVSQARSWSESADPDSLFLKRALSRLAAELPFYCDPSRADRIDAFVRNGIQALGAENSIKDGIARVANMLAIRKHDNGERYSRFYVRPCCVNTIWEFGNYRRRKDPLNPGEYLETPIDRNNHAMDAARYALIERFGRLSSSRAVVSGR